MNRMVPLAKIARAALGYKSLQNDFFYVNQATIDTFKIEGDYLTPITTFRELDARCYKQKQAEATWLFLCREQEGDLRGTGALKYIHTMAGRPAAKKKQTGQTLTIEEALSAQGGGLWYAPKASPHPAKLWLRKAIGSVYAPFIFTSEAVVDQRCNYLEPLPDVTWEELGAVLTTTLFAYGVEINGSASMGAGALEAATTKLRQYPVFDPRSLKPTERRELVKLARAVWAGEAPPDWLADRKPGPKLCKLDAWLLTLSGTKVQPETLYADLAATCTARSAVAEDKVRTTKKKTVENLTSVAKGIADKERRMVNGKRFPEHFVDDGRPTQLINVEGSGMRRIRLEPLLDQASITVSGEGGKTVFYGTYRASVAEAIIRALLMGRENFLAPARHDDAEAAVSGFLTWFDAIRLRLKAAIDESAFGTGYEVRLSAEVYQRLGIHPLAGERVLPPEISLAGMKTPDVAIAVAAPAKTRARRTRT